MATTAVFIDAGYLEKLMLFEYPDKRIDYAKLVQAISKPHEMLRAYWYHCMPYKSDPPTEEEKKRYSARQRFVTALSHLPRFEVRLGRLAKRGEDKDGKPIFQQKRVDCMVGVDMSLLAAKGKIDYMELISGDSDLVPAVEAVKRESVIVRLWHGSFSEQCRPSRELVEICDDRRLIDNDLIMSILRS